MTTGIIQSIFDTIFYGILLLVCIREFVLSLLILTTKKAYKLFSYYLSWPQVFVEKLITGKKNDKYDKNYTRLIRFYAWSSLFGAPLIILACVLTLMNSWG